MKKINIFYGNDRVTKLLDWLYIGGIENNAFRTLEFVDIWINFAHESKKEEQIHLKIKNKKILYYPLRFDDGDLSKGQENWLKTYEIINQHKGKRFLISCTEGVSRSAVMCLWLLCEELGNYNEALIYLKSKRKIYIDKNFNDFLIYLEDVYS